MIGTKDSTVADLVKMVNHRVAIRDVLGENKTGVLKWVSNWNIGVMLDDPYVSAEHREVTVMFKGNLIMITPIGEASDER